MSAGAQTAANEQGLHFGWQRPLPMIRQTEVTECGLACLAMIAGFHGFVTDMASLRRRFRLSTQGANLKTLIEVAGNIQLGARALRADLGAVNQLQLPCVLHWDMNHFVVLKALRFGHAIVHDPARGIRKLTMDEFAQHYTGIALELTPSEAFTPERSVARTRLYTLWSRITGLKRNIALILGLSLLLQLYALAAPFYVQTVVDDVVLRQDTGLLAALATGFALLLVIEVVTQSLRSGIILHLSTRLHLQLASNLFRHLLRLPLDFFQRRHLGDVLSRFTSIDAVRQVMSTGLVSALVDGLMATLTLIAMFIYDARLAGLVLAIVGLYMLIRAALFPSLRRLTEQSIALSASSESSLIESIRAIQTIKLHQRENERQSQWQNRLANAMNSDIRIARLGIGFDAASTALFGAENIIVVYFAATAVMDNSMSLGMFFAFMSYKRRFVEAMDNLVSQLIELKMLGLHLERIGDIALTKQEPCLTPDAKIIDSPGATAAKASLSAQALAFRYSDIDPYVFENLSFTIRPGETVAIVGPSGLGKTTLLKCLMGLVQPCAGVICLGDAPLTNIPGYRRCIGAVLQDDQLLSGTIAENIACFDNDLNLDKVKSCAEMACIHEDIGRLPMQYNTPVGDMGSALSGGQVQRIMLARAFYRQPAILFLDEATSHLDIETERRINQHIAAMHITRVMVAHRPETIALADTVIELRRDCRETVSRNGA